MKKVLSLLMFALLSLGAWAGEVVFDFQNNLNALGITAPAPSEGTNLTAPITYQGITMSYTNGGTATRIWNSNGTYSLRFYKNGSITLASSVGNIVEITFDGTVASTADVGTLSGKKWTGEANSVTFTATGTNTIYKITITTLESGQVLAPTFSPAGGTYYEAQNVKITAGEGATINYTLDGSNPTTSSAVYSEPINVAATTTIKAIATKDGVSSEVATATYTIETAPTVANIAAFGALDDNTSAAIGNPVVVTYANGQNTYVKDATGFMCIYGNELSGKYTQGDVIPAGFGGVKTIYNTGLEMKYPLFGFEDATETQTVEADEVTVANFGNSQMWQYVVLKGAQITYHNGKNLGFRVDNSTDSVAGFNQFNLTLPDLDATYDIYGIVTSHQGSLEMYPVEFIDNNPTTVANIAELMALESGKNATITGTVTVMYHSGKQLYIKDESASMLVFGSLSNDYVNGDQLTGIAGNWTVHNGLTEIIPVTATFGEATPGTPVEPELITIEEIDQSMIHNYLRMENCTIDSIAGSNGRNFTLTDETGEIIMRLNFNEVTIGEDFDYDATYNVEGFLAYYKKSDGTVEQLQFYPNLIEKVGGSDVVPGDVNGDGQVTATDVTLLYNIILSGDYTGAVNYDQNNDGSVTSSDVTLVYNAMLGTSK